MKWKDVEKAMKDLRHAIGEIDTTKGSTVESSMTAMRALNALEKANEAWFADLQRQLLERDFNVRAEAYRALAEDMDDYFKKMAREEWDRRDKKLSEMA